MLVEGPREQFLAAEVARDDPAGVVEPDLAAVGGVGVEVAPDYEKHLVERVTFPYYIHAFRPKSWL